MKYKVTLSTVVSCIVEVDADDEDAAFDAAFEAARDFSGQHHAGRHAAGSWVADFNDEWQYEDPTIEEV